MTKMRVLVSVLVLSACLPASLCLDNGLGRTPQMGWNSWNHYACNINENLIKATADAFITSGLSKFGYNYVNMDDCWALTRDDKGIVHEDPKAFPSGIKALADYVHAKGLKFGLYSDAGSKTCAGRPGSLQYEANDANTYAAWGVDYLKYDNCNNENISPEKRYPIMRNALNATNRHIFFSMCEWGQDNPATWAGAVGNSWRTTGDIQDTWASMLGNLDHNGVAADAGPGGWNDPDMLEVGNGGMTYNEEVAHFSLWSIVKAPLLIGCDVTTIEKNNQTLAILTNAEVIAINQDPLGKQATKVASVNGGDVWAGPLADKAVAVVLLNRNNATMTIQANWNDLNVPLTDKYIVRDLWAHQNLGTFFGHFSASVPPHSVKALKLTPTQ